jgi:hypothetical protein
VIGVTVNSEREETNTGSGLQFCDSRALAPRTFNNTTVANDRESQIASPDPVYVVFGAYPGGTDTVPKLRHVMVINHDANHKPSISIIYR